MIFKCNGIFLEAKRKLVNQAQKVLYSLYKNIRNQAFPTDLQLILFLEQVHLMFCKRILKVRSTTTNYMVYGELGRIPLEITIEIKMASFWRNMIYGNKIRSCMYKLLFSLKQNGVHTFKWLNFIKSILNDT